MLRRGLIVLSTPSVPLNFKFVRSFVWPCLELSVAVLHCVKGPCVGLIRRSLLTLPVHSGRNLDLGDQAGILQGSSASCADSGVGGSNNGIWGDTRSSSRACNFLACRRILSRSPDIGNVCPSFWRSTETRTVWLSRSISTASIKRCPTYDVS